MKAGADFGCTTNSRFGSIVADAKLLDFLIGVAQPVQHPPHVDMVQDHGAVGQAIELAVFESRLRLQPGNVVGGTVHRWAVGIGAVGVEDLELPSLGRMEKEQKDEAKHRRCQAEPH